MHAPAAKKKQEQKTWFTCNQADTPERSPQRAGGVDAAMGEAFNTQEKPNSEPTKGGSNDQQARAS